MFEPPAIAHEAIIAAVQENYGLRLAALTFLPIGHDPLAWVYRAEASDGTAYFLKLRRDTINLPALLVPHMLLAQGVEHVLAPLPTTAQTLWAEVADYALVLYPFIAGRNGMEQAPSTHQWVEFGATMRRVHELALAPELSQQLKRETWKPGWFDLLGQIDAEIDSRTSADVIEQEISDFLRSKRSEIDTLIRRTSALSQRMQQANLPLVVCHADAHPANLLIDNHERLWIVDWDEVMLAPKERDLMFILGGIFVGQVTPQQQALFFEGYGSTNIDPTALAYYRYAWAVQDIGSYAEQIFLTPDAGETTKQSAAHIFMSLFDANGIVAIAFATPEGD